MIDLAKILGHYEGVFNDNDEGLLSIFYISETLIQKIEKFDQNIVVNVLFSIILNVQATKTISEENRSKVHTLMALLAKKSGMNSVAELHSSEIGPILGKIIKNK